MSSLTEVTIGENKFLTEYEGTQILNKFGLPVATSTITLNVEEAVKAAQEIGYPIVLKGMSPQITHKTEAGIVKVNILTESQLREAYEQIVNNAKAYDASAEWHGVLVQKMAPKGIELIIGIKRDDTFGHQLVLGFGGTLVEIFKDFTMRMLPVSEKDIEEMVDELQTAPILKGYRGEKGINLESLKQIGRGVNRLVDEIPSIEEMDLNPIIFARDEAFICDVRILLSEVKDNTRTPRPLDQIYKMLNPESIAIVGASDNVKKTGGRLIKYLVENDYKGKIYPINPKAQEIQGLPVYDSLLKIPANVDVACIVVAAKLVPNVMRECAEMGIPNALIYSSGFAEVGEEGQRLQEEILEIAHANNIRILGPNTIGLASPLENVYTAFGSALDIKEKVAGSVGFVSQSGAMGSALLSRAWEKNIGFSRWISVANEADLNTADFIDVLADDPQTKVISVFMEGIKDVVSFEKAAQKAFDNKKPLLVYKTGRTEAGKKAVQSHTGSMAGDDAVYEVALKKWKALRVNQIEALIDVAAAFERQPLPKGKRIGIITASGGACSILADLCTQAGLEVAPFTTQAETIKELVPSFGSANNPIDVTAEIIGKPEMFKQILEAVVADEGIDGVLVMMTSNADPGAAVIAEAIVDVFNQSAKPIVLGRLGAEVIAPKGMKYYRDHNFAVYENPEKIVQVMKYLVEYAALGK